MYEGLSRIDGKVAVITGAGYGIGRSIALALTAHGAYTVCLDRHAERWKENVDLIHQSRFSAEPILGDVSDETSVEPNWVTIASRRARDDILDNNAGITTSPVRTHELVVADCGRVPSTDLRGVFLTTRAALRLMLPGPGSIINIASVAALRGCCSGFSTLPVYICAAKAGVVGLGQGRPS